MKPVASLILGLLVMAVMVIDAVPARAMEVEVEGLAAVINGNVYAGGDVQLGQGATITGNYPLPYQGCPLSISGIIVIQTWEIRRQ